MVAGARLLACRDLDRVARLVAGQSRFAWSMKELRATREKDHHYLLCAPATVALAVTLLGIHWPKDRPLRLALLGAGRDDFIDAGQWYRFVPAMLGHDRALSVCAFDHSGRPHHSRVRRLLLDQHAIEASAQPHAFSEYPLDASSAFDLAVAFSPLKWWGGRAGSKGRLQSDLQALRARQIPLVFAASSSTHALLLHAIFTAFAAQPKTLMEINPFALVSKRAGEQFARTLSFVPVESLPAPEAAFDDELLEMMTVPAQMVLACHYAGDPSQPWAVGAPVSQRVVHTIGGVAVNLDTLEVTDLSSERPLGHLDASYREHFEDYDPGSS